MNVKSVVNNIIPIEPQKRAESANGVRTQESTERDANGRRDPNQEEQKSQLTDEEFNQALLVLQDNQGVKANNLRIRIAVENEKRIVYIEDLDGKPIRRFTEAELWAVTRSQDRPTGTIYDKAM